MASSATRWFLVCAVLSTGVYHFLSFSLSFAVSFDVRIFLVAAQLRLVWASNSLILFVQMELFLLHFAHIVFQFLLRRLENYRQE